jgi:PAS domain S-box-containing protein
MADITKIDAFVQSSPHPAWLATSRGECLYVNPALERLTGLKSDQINQVDWRSFVLEEDRAAASASWQKSLASGTPHRTRARLRGFDGVPATVELIAFGHTLNDGMELWLFTGLPVHGTTQQYPRLEAQLQATLNVIPAYTWYALPSGGLTFVNERSGDYLGLPKDHPLRFGIDTGAEWDAHIPLLHPDDRKEARRAWSVCIGTGSAGENSQRVRNAEGEYRWFLSRVEPLRASDGTLLYWIGVNLDIDERKRAEEQLMKSAREMQKNEFYLVEAQRLGHVGSWVLVFEPVGAFEYWSDELFRIYGFDPERDAPTLDEYLASVHPHDREFMASLIKRMFAEALGCDVTKRIVRPNGEVRHIRCVGAPVLENGTLKRIIGNAIDVTEHELLTRELRRREAYLAEAQRLSHTGSFGWNPDTGDLVWTDETYRIFEYDGATKPTLDMVVQRVHPQDRALAQQVIDRASQTDTDFEHEYRLLLADGRVKHVHAIAHALQDASGNLEFIGAVTDITERKTAEEALRSSEAYLLEAQRLTRTGSWAWSPVVGDIRYWSEECYRVLGFDPAESPPRFETFFQRIHPDDQAATRERFEKAIRDKADFQMDYRIVHPDGETRNIHVVGHPTLGPSGDLREFVGTVIDVTERLRAEERIRRNEKELRTLIEAIPAYVGTNQPDGSVDFISQSWLDYTGFSREQGMGWGWGSAIHPEDFDRVVADWRAAVAAGAPAEHELRCRRADGTYHWFLYRGLPFRDDGGNVVKWYGTLTNIDALKEIEHALKTREHELLGIIETIPSMLWSTSPAGETTHLSQRILEYCGAPLEELVNRGWERSIHPDDREETAKAFGRAISSGESYSAIHRVRRADGEYRWHHSMGEPLRDPHGKIIRWYGLAIDIDERKRAEDHLRDTRIKLAKASRLATVAELAGSIAHELNQPLMSILANAQAAKRWLNAAPPNVTEVNSSIERIIRDARAADETMQHIRALFKQESFDKKDVNIPNILREVVRVVQEDPKKRDVPIECRFEESLPVVSVDQIQIQQVFINLIVNAIEALEGQQVAPLLVLRAATDSNGMLVQVIDNGPGVDDPDRIFDAFMTTKEKGMGIGLAVSRSIVEAHGGRLWAENNKTGGATFNVALPLSHASPTTAYIQEYA